MENTGSEICSVRSGTEDQQSSQKKIFNLNAFTLSVPALNFFRFSFGFLILYDLIQHFIDISFFYTKNGIVPLQLALEKAGSWHYGIYFISDQPAIVTGIYLVHIALAFLFMIGKGLPWVTIILWFFQFSLRNRNFNINDAGDDLAIIFLFISIFLPLKQSLDSSLSSGFKKGWQSLWSLVFITQLLCMYFFSALQKNDPSWNENFTATFITLHLTHISSHFGQWLLQFPNFLKIPTAIFYYLELLGPPIFFVSTLFSTQLSTQIRKTICIAFIFFHLSLLISMRLWSFPLYCVAAWLMLYLSIIKPSPSIHPSSSENFKLKHLLFLWPALILGVILSWNFSQLNHNMAMPKPIRTIGRTLSLWQNWGMFAPYPMLNNQSISFFGESGDGEKIEIFSQNALHENRHRMKLALNFATMDQKYLSSIAEYFCNKNPSLTRVQFDVNSQIINKDSLETSEKKYTLWAENCNQSK